LGRNGIYYRKKIGGSTAKRTSNAGRNRTSLAQYQYNYRKSEADFFTDAIRISDSASNSELGREIISDINKSR
jgi:hypothetical protein